MPLIPKSALTRNLDTFRVWRVDTDPSSRYFRVSQFPTVLTAGRNSFLINGSPELVPYTDVLIEIKDALGNPIYHRPIRNYTEGLSRVVSIEILPSTEQGIATLTILGQLRADVDGNTPPPEFVNAYNVRWTTQIAVDSRKLPFTPIRTEAVPEISARERLVIVRSDTPVITQIISARSTVAPITNTNITTQGDRIYAIKVADTASPLSREVVGGTVAFAYDTASYTGSVIRVLNTQVCLARFDASIALPEVSVVSASVLYTGSTNAVITNYSRSYADISYKKLDTFSGQLYRAKIYVRGAEEDVEAGFVPVDDAILAPRELLAQQSIYGDLINVGATLSQEIVSSYWTGGVIATDFDTYLGDFA